MHHKKYPQLENNRFVNYPGEKQHSFFWQTVYMYVRSLFTRSKHTAYEVRRLAELDNHLVGGPQPTNEQSDIQVTWIGHATFLVTLDNFSILTDPVFGDLSFLFKRAMAPGIGIENLPPIDAVVISHNHRDHLDEPSVRALIKRNPECHFFVPFGDKAWFVRRGFVNVTECMWWDENVLLRERSEPLSIQFLPAFHWSQRGLFDRNKSLWGSWLLKVGSRTVYFAGDTAYSRHFSAIAQEIPSIDVALLPIGPCEPHEWMKASHMNAEEAGHAFLDLKARVFIPMHWGTYRFGTDHIFTPLDRIVAWWKKSQAKLIDGKLVTPACGKTVSIEAEPFTPVESPRSELTL